MIRVVLFAAFAYIWGDPSYSSMRPDFVSTPLETYHIEMRGVLGEAFKASGVVVNVNNMQSVSKIARLM